MTGLGKIRGRIIVAEGLKMGLLYDLVEEEAHAGTTFQSTDFDLEWRLAPAKPETLRSLSTRPILPDDMPDCRRVELYFARLESWIKIEREDFEPPDLSGLHTEEKRTAISEALTSNARPHMVSKARAPINIKWGEEKNIRRWR